VRLVTAGWLLLAAAALPAAETQLSVQSASLQLVENVYQLDARVAIDLPPGAQRAIDTGLTMHFEFEIEISRVRRYMPDAGVATVVQSFEVVFHALSQRYLLRNLNTGEQADFGTLAAVLEHLSEINGLPLIDSTLLPPGESYEGRIRAVLDMGNVPEALRWLMFWTDDWSVSSEWYTWKLQP
jgi:hypothetical protein